MGHALAREGVGGERSVSLIADESDGRGGIVKEILLANQLDAGRLAVEFEPFEPADLVERVVEATRAYAPPSVTVTYSAPEGLPHISADLAKARPGVVHPAANAVQ